MEHGDQDLRDLPELTLQRDLLEPARQEQARRGASCAGSSGTLRVDVHKAL